MFNTCMASVFGLYICKYTSIIYIGAEKASVCRRMPRVCYGKNVRGYVCEGEGVRM